MGYRGERKTQREGIREREKKKTIEKEWKNIR